MGAFLSVSGHGHPSHPEHYARFNRVDRNDSPPSPCRMCNLNVETGAAAYRCSEPGCAVVLHDGCYRRSTTLRRHFGHPQHRLTLGADTRAGLSCSLCAQPLGTPTVAYSCGRSTCAGFSAHPRCCNLPRNMTTPPDLHEHTRLELRPPSSAAPGGKNGEARPRRACLNCRKTATTAGRKAAPWSYQCRKCAGVEYCLACVLGHGGSTVQCCCLPCCDVDPAAVHCVGQLAGALFCGFLSGMGCPGIPTQPYPGNMELAPRYRS